MARDKTFSRRTVMKLTGATAATALVAGCGGDDGGNGGNGNGGDGGDGGNGGGGGFEPGTQIEFGGYTQYWEGINPSSIEGEENPTIELQEGETYEIGWTEGDGANHNIEIRNGDDEVVDDLSTDTTDDPGDDQWLEFEASSEMAEYVCDPHADVGMRGDIEIV